MGLFDAVLGNASELKIEDTQKDFACSGNSKAIASLHR